jgi:hypothetical protein
VPFYRFLIHGSFVDSRAKYRGFYTTRWARAATEAQAARKALENVARDWRSGASAKLHSGIPPILEIEEGYRIFPWQIWSAPNRGSTFYLED